MISGVHTILFVEDQEAAKRFYARVLQVNPILDVPGMTEFELGEATVLGLMPRKGAERIVGDLAQEAAPSGELYLLVDDPKAYLERALAQGAELVSQIDQRDWGDIAGYCKTPDGHLLAFAKYSGAPK